MTDRAQPGAIDSVIRNDELAQVLGQLTGGFDDGWVVDPADPTAASRRRTGINESAFDGFALSGVSSSSLSVDVGPGEAFAGGWIATDASKSVNLPANTTSTIVALMDLNAIYDPQNDPDRDAADKVVIDIAANVSDDLPRVRLHEAATDSSGVTSTTDLRKPYGPALEADSGTVGSLEAGSLSDGIVNNDTVSDIRGNWETIAFESDSTSGPLSLDITGLPTDNRTFRIVVQANHNGSSAADIQCRLSGNSTSNYQYLTISDSLNTNTGQTEFALASGVNRPMRGAFVIAASDSRIGDSRFKEPTISSDWVAHDYPDANLQQGSLKDTSAFPVDEVNVFTPTAEGVGRLHVQRLIDS